MHAVPSRVDLKKQKSLIPSTQHWTFWLAPEISCCEVYVWALNHLVKAGSCQCSSFFDREESRSYLSQTEREWKYLVCNLSWATEMTDFDLYGGFEPMMVYSLHCTKQWQKSFEFVIFYTGRQSHLCLSVFTCFQARQNCPLAKGQRPQEAQTWQKTLGPQHSILQILQL